MVDDTLSQNIALGVPKDEVDKQRLQKVIVQAGLAGLVETLLKGVDTFLGKMGYVSLAANDNGIIGESVISSACCTDIG